MEVRFSYSCSAGYLLVTVKVASSIFVNQLNATNLKSSKTQFQFQFELSLAQLSPSLSLFIEVFFFISTFFNFKVILIIGAVLLFSVIFISEDLHIVFVFILKFCFG